MTVAAIRSAIVARLAAVPDIGVVHGYQRYAHNLKDLAALYRSAAHNQLRGWNITRISTAETGNVQGRTLEVIRWRILGVLALDDSAQSELTFDGLIEAVRNAFAQDETLSGTVAMCSDPEGHGETGIQVDDAGPGKFADVFAHIARLSLLTVRYLDRSIP